MNKLRTIICFFIIILITSNNSFAADNILSINPVHIVIIIVMFVCSIFFLNKTLFKPLLELDDKREKLTSGASSEAKELKLKAEQTIKEYTDRINEARIHTQEERNLIRKADQSSASEMIEKVRSEMNSLLQDAKSKIEDEAVSIREKIKPEIEIIAKDVASKLIKKEI